MREHTLEITIALKEGMLDPEARAIQHALKNLGFPTGDLKTAQVFLVTLPAASTEEARRVAGEMCERLLANPVIHTYTIGVRE
ncbi:MAG: phosphoribosylformylglycinamidine synthase subunit PurS [Methanomicrobiaceae archaeon]|nr:phosphoribosylformylglycinamidine synthase subunit PurS [Methanomicrobiaceae archaeon]